MDEALNLGPPLRDPQSWSPASAFAPLFTPVRVNGCALANRIVMAPMTRSCGIDGVVSELAIDYYKRRAEGGTGLILTEGIAVNRQGAPSRDIPELVGAQATPVWERVVRAVHGAGGKIMAQLWHTGLLRGTQGEVDRSIPSVGPSDVYPGMVGDVEMGPPVSLGAAMTLDDIKRTIADCARFADVARNIGFDGVEVHGAHGYLFDQFFWERTNRRTDSYGGDIARRTKFAVETIHAMREATAADSPIGLRFSQWKMPGYYQLRPLCSSEELGEFLAPLVKSGIDFFDCSTRRYWEPAFPDSRLTLAQWTKRLSGAVTMAVGSVGLSGPLMTTHEEIGTRAASTDNVTTLAKMVADKEIDLVGVGRAIIANPDWANRVERGETDQLVAWDISKLAQLR
jgi:2,4-dienoyl-CoA reductase-like NADH-dependent reductase (Old Yellow Enzyme family)